MEDQLSNGYVRTPKGSIVPGNARRNEKYVPQSAEPQRGRVASMLIALTVFLTGCGYSAQATERAPIYDTTATAAATATVDARNNSATATATAEAAKQGPAVPKPGELPPFPNAQRMEAITPKDRKVLVSSILGTERLEITSEKDVWINTPAIQQVADLVFRLSTKYYPSDVILRDLESIPGVKLNLSLDTIQSNSPTAFASTNVDTNTIFMSMNRIKNGVAAEKRGLGFDITQEQLQIAVLADELSNLYTKFIVAYSAKPQSIEEVKRMNQDFSTAMFTVVICALTDNTNDIAKGYDRYVQASKKYKSPVLLSPDDYRFVLDYLFRNQNSLVKGFYSQITK
jgi:hypothetical protein